MRLSCFSFHLHHRAHHSFPTRRSSDLHGRGGLWAVRAAGGSGLGLASSFRPRPGVAPYYIVEQGIKKKLKGRLSYSDRKSTRLNSSHLVSSYAVFCLKKKKNKHV